MHRTIKKARLYPSDEVRRLIGGDTRKVTILALRALLQARTVEAALGQVAHRGQPLTFSSRLTKAGILAIDVDLGDPRMAGRVIREGDLRAATLAAEAKARIEARAKREGERSRRW